MTFGDYVDTGYVDTGYVFDPRCPVSFISGSDRVDLRGPSSVSGQVRMLQPDEYSTGQQRFGFSAAAIVHTLSMQYNRLNGTEATDLNTFRAAVDGSAKQFTYNDPAQGLDFLCWFDSPDLNLERPGYDQFRGTIPLWSAATFFPLAGGVSVPDINAADSILTRLFNPASVNVSRKQPRTRLSDGTVCIYNKSTIERTTRTISLLRRTRTEMAALIAFFSQSAQGTRYTFPWTFEGSALTVRFSSSGLSWQRSSVNTRLFDVTATLEEDTAL